jgi:RNA polymerase sigma-70 factor (sigma-E family)
MTEGVTDERSFDDAFPELFLSAFRLAHRMLGDRAIAEDVAADALAITLERWRRVAPLPYRTAWVLRVTANLALRSAKRRDRAPVVAERDRPVEGFERDVDLRLALRAALARLPRRQRDVVILRYLCGLSEKDIAEMLGVSSGSVKTHTHRGLAALRRTLGPDVEEAGLAAI